MKLISVILFLLFVCCNIQSCNTNNAGKNKPLLVDSLKAKLIGNWGGLGEDSPVWEIKHDSIYYYQEQKTYPYQIVGSDLIIERLDTKGILKNISVLKDTLMFYDEQGLQITGYRFLNKK